MKKVKEGYKMTELGEIPEEWGVSNLIDISQGKGEYGIGAVATEYISGNPRYLRITDIGDGSKLLFNDIKGLSDDEYGKYLLKQNDIVFARTGNTTGKSYVYNEKDGELVYAGFLIKFTINPELADVNFVKYIVQSKRYWDWVSVVSTRSGQPGINSNEYATFLVQLPGIEEQRNITSILSSVDEQIETVDKLIEKTKELKKGLTQRLLTKGIVHEKFKDTEIGKVPEEWEIKKLGDICDFKQGFQIPRSEQIVEEKGGYIRYLYITDFFSDKNKLYVKDDGKFYYIEPEDITIANTGNTCGKPFRGASGVLSNNMFKIFNKKDVLDNNFLWQYLNSEIYWEQLKKYFNTAGQPHVGHKNMSELKIALPDDISEQQKISSILSSVDEQIEEYEWKKEKLQELKKGLMQKLLMGKIRIKI